MWISTPRYFGMQYGSWRGSAGAKAGILERECVLSGLDWGPFQASLRGAGSGFGWFPPLKWRAIFGASLRDASFLHPLKSA
jgi:hypothetical protein